jgi:hypothetical protein
LDNRKRRATFERLGLSVIRAISNGDLRNSVGPASSTIDIMNSVQKEYSNESLIAVLPSKSILSFQVQNPDV